MKSSCFYRSELIELPCLCSLICGLLGVDSCGGLRAGGHLLLDAAVQPIPAPSGGARLGRYPLPFRNDCRATEGAHRCGDRHLYDHWICGGIK